MKTQHNGRAPSSHPSRARQGPWTGGRDLVSTFYRSLRVESLQPTGYDLFQKRLLGEQPQGRFPDALYGQAVTWVSLPLPFFLCALLPSPVFLPLYQSQFNSVNIMEVNLHWDPRVHSCQGELQLWSGGGVPRKPGEAHLSLRNPNPQEGFPRNTAGKESACNAGDSGSIPGSGRSPGEGNGNPLQYSYLGNPMDMWTW